MHVREFRCPPTGVIVVFSTANGATLERDVRDPATRAEQISDARASMRCCWRSTGGRFADSSAGKFLAAGRTQRFVTESSEHLARLYGDPGTAKAFANMPVVIVGYSGGFVPAAWSLEVGGLATRARRVSARRGVMANSTSSHPGSSTTDPAFFQRLYALHQSAFDNELMQMLKEKASPLPRTWTGRCGHAAWWFVETTGRA